jgi:hypothetical protein
MNDPKSKYICLEELQYRYLIMDWVILIFPAFIKHIDFAKKFEKETIISAGFVDLKNQQCYGESNSLKLKSREIDTKLLQSQYFNK